jgi:hypothetical protein
MTIEMAAKNHQRLAEHLSPNSLGGMGFTLLQDYLFAVAGSYRLKDISERRVISLIEH